MLTSKQILSYSGNRVIPAKNSFQVVVIEPKRPALFDSGVEETAARILKILTDRMGHLHPIWNSQGEISG